MKDISTIELGQTRRLYARPGFKFPSGRPFSPNGEQISLDAFWIKRLGDGTVSLTPPALAKPTSEKAEPTPQGSASGKSNAAKPPKTQTSED